MLQNIPPSEGGSVLQNIPSSDLRGDQCYRIFHPLRGDQCYRIFHPLRGDQCYRIFHPLWEEGGGWVEGGGGIRATEYSILWGGGGSVLQNIPSSEGGSVLQNVPFSVGGQCYRIFHPLKWRGISATKYSIL